MVRFLYGLGICALFASGGVLGLCLRARNLVDVRLNEILNQTSAMQRFRTNDGKGLLGKSEPPLIVQAQAMHLYLNPPKSLEKSSVPVVSPSPPAPAIRPAAPSVKFRLCATSYYPNQPRRSMALIAELGSAEGNKRWVKEGTQVGHFVIHEIRRGAIVYRDGDNLREIVVERRASLPSIVRDLRPGSVRVSAAVGGTDSVTPVLAGPNGIEIAGGN